MGYITNQWLKGDAERRKGWRPIQVDMHSESRRDEEDSWYNEHDVVVEIKATRSEADYQVVLFTEQDLAGILNRLVRAASMETRDNIFEELLEWADNDQLAKLLVRHKSDRHLKGIAKNILSQLNDAEFLEFLSDFLAERAKKQEPS